MRIINLFKNRDRRSKAELRGVIVRLEQRNTELNKENGKLQATIDKKNEAIDQLNKELSNMNVEHSKQHSVWKKILSEKRDEISRLKRDLQAANGIIDAMREDRQETDAEQPQPKRRRYSQRGSNGKFVKSEVKE